ncbi:hypothetical protein BV210_13700 [Halorientalis sp. IM1011]|uniref:DUF4382 domain-containing protein n=1 Tax=Halorientalis sp. IM1011 TaxID=1932360 RepID=UPI00097CC0D8|nr:DUF4382 domain-containing protein [Halorientalis sp. IM1011]AQL43692.1 hypothetical protein BV210_13700 [Halorientalis sp. IM1011]
MDRRQFLEATGIAAAGTAIAGCSGDGQIETGTLATSVTDQPSDIDDFETLVLRLTGLRTTRAGDGTVSDDTVTGTASDGEDGERTIDIEETEVDLTELADGDTSLIDETELETGEYEYLKLVVGEVVEARLTGGDEATVETPGNAPLKFNERFEIRADQRTSFLADFTPVKQGRSGRYLIKPVADGVEVSYEDESTATTA